MSAPFRGHAGLLSGDAIQPELTAHSALARFRFKEICEIARLQHQETHQVDYTRILDGPEAYYFGFASHGPT